MKKYSREERYRPIEHMDQDYFDKQKQKVQSDKDFYPHFHIAPPYGLLNDPNGLAEFHGEHHIFYQYHPVAPTHGLKYWYHLSTKDFVSYKDWGIALYPDSESDSHGVYSGGALVKGDELILFYTGNKFDKNWIRTPSQSIAVMNKDGEISKKTQIIPCDGTFTEHFRDPKPWQVGNKYYLIVGAQTQNKKGCLVLYRSNYINKDWEKVGIIQTAFNVDAYMYECPDYFELNDKSVILFSPQGLKSQDEFSFKNIFNVVYSLSSPMSLEQAIFKGSNFFELDKGFDFYAPQTYQDTKGRRILIAWLGIGDLYYPYDEENRWSQMLTIPRELSIDQGRLVQTPIIELQNLRTAKQKLENGLNPIDTASFELALEFKEKFTIRFLNQAGEFIFFEADEDYTLDRTNQGIDLNLAYGSIRRARRINKENQKVQLYYDKSSLEIFIDGGKTVFSSRIFLKNIQSIEIDGLKEGVLYQMKRIQYLK